MSRATKEQIETIYRQVNEISGIYHAALRRMGISDNEFWIGYSLIAVKGAHTQQSICSAWSLSKQTVNTIVKRMVEKNYAVLDVIPGTRNSKRIRLTEEGKKYGASIISPICDSEEKAFGRLSEGELDACIGLLKKFTTAFKDETGRNQLNP